MNILATLFLHQASVIQVIGAGVGQVDPKPNILHRGEDHMWMETVLFCKLGIKL